ncbi:MAG: hypothetical protein ACI8QC_001416 [Planctomycetota bacterium]|jgi:hypothetical protein
MIIKRSCAVLLLAACSPLSEQAKDPAIGRNGGFEAVRDELPVNWLVYTPGTIPRGSYTLSFDSADFKEGKQSLHFDVQECSGEPGWRSPGIAQELPARAGSKYRVSFWIKSAGCEWSASAGGVSAKTGDMSELASYDPALVGWQYVEREVALSPRSDRLRFELNLGSPGKLWIDAVRMLAVGE